MTDTRPRVTYTKTIDLAALDTELGGHGLCASDTEIVVAEGSPVTQKQLEAAVAAHVAPPPAPPTPSTQEQLDALTAALVAKAVITDADADATKAKK